MVYAFFFLRILYSQVRLILSSLAALDLFPRYFLRMLFICSDVIFCSFLSIKWHLLKMISFDFISFPFEFMKPLLIRFSSSLMFPG